MTYIGYIRVSTVKQGTKGVSLQEQRDAILRYAERKELPVGLWLTEVETAAKQGRPIFTQALRVLRQGKAHGIILHKLDRGARNLKDWAAIAELADQGIEVHFVNESLDLQSRGGRLSADIQAVVAADFIRNIREETRKGFYGRLKQGLYPLRAPIGYLDQGKGKPKSIDPVMGPLVRRAFEMYATALHSLDTLGEVLHRLGLRNRHGGGVTRNGLSTLLNNPFYMGIIRIRKTAESFEGIHDALIGKRLFDRVQVALAGKLHSRVQRHEFGYRRLLTCAACEHSLIGERQKGHVYYRCHTKQCRGTSIREEAVVSEIQKLLSRLRFSKAEEEYFAEKVQELKEGWTTKREEQSRSLNLRFAQIKDRLNRLTDAYLDQALDKTMFEERKRGLLEEQKALEQQIKDSENKSHQLPDRLEKFLELAGNAWLSHEMGLPEEKRKIIEIVTSNRTVCGKKLDLRLSIPFAEVANRAETMHCDQQRDILRTFEALLPRLAAWFETNTAPATCSLNDALG